jgi:hypothetical protein
MEEVVEQLSPDLQAALRAGGWYPGRKLNVDQAALALESAGYAVPPEVRQFLEEFSGVSLRPQSTIHPPAVFDAELAAADDIEDVLQTFAESTWPHPRTIGEDLCAIGHLGQSTLLMTPKTAIYCAFEGSISLVGRSTAEALDALWKDDIYYKKLPSWFRGRPG